MPILEVLSFEICRMYPERFLRHILKMVSKKICFGAFLNLILSTTVRMRQSLPLSDQRVLNIGFIEPSIRMS